MDGRARHSVRAVLKLLTEDDTIDMGCIPEIRIPRFAISGAHGVTRPTTPGLHGVPQF